MFLLCLLEIMLFLREIYLNGHSHDLMCKKDERDKTALHVSCFFERKKTSPQ